MIIWFSCTHKQVKLVKIQVYEIEKVGDSCILKEFEEDIWICIYCQQVWIIASARPCAKCFMAILSLNPQNNCMRQTIIPVRGKVPSKVNPKPAWLPTTLQPPPKLPHILQVTITSNLGSDGSSQTLMWVGTNKLQTFFL